MKIPFPAILFIVVIFTACQKEESKPLPESGYPTTYNILSQTEWNNVNVEFQKINNSDSLTIDEYGFLEGSIRYENKNDRLDAEFVIEKVDSIILRYSEYLGVDGAGRFSSEDKLRGYDYSIMHGYTTDVYGYFEGVAHFEETMLMLYELNEQILVHVLTISQEQIEDRPILNAVIRFTFNEQEGRVRISGHWFPDVFIPSNEIYSEKEAVEIAFDLAENNLNAEYNLSGNLYKDNCKVEKQFTPVYKENSIELHECWYVHIPVFRDGDTDLYYNYYKIFVDTQTGDVELYTMCNNYPY